VYIKKNMLYQQVYVLVVFPMYDLYKTKYREIDLLAQLLSSGFSSRLFKALREDKGITYNSSSYPIAYSDSGMFLIQMVVNPVELITGLKIIMRELRKIKNELITKDEMKKIVNVTKNENIYALTKPTNLLIYFGLNFLSDANFKMNLKQDMIDLKKITRAHIQKIAREIFVQDKINLFIYGNVQETNFNFLNL
jgi:predicted Zn-dependent peptidase